LKVLESIYDSLPNDTSSLHCFNLINPNVLENEERFLNYIKKVNDLTTNYRHLMISGAVLNEEPSEEVKLQSWAEVFDRWKIPRSELL
jgi:hypothetical protein